MNYKITDIEGIGPAYAEKLTEAKIQTTEDLLEMCSTPAGRTNVAESTGIGDSVLLKWTNMADLMRVSGVVGQYAELLKAAGVDTIKELRNRNAENLADKLNEINAEKKLTKGSAAANTVQQWVDQAKKLDPRITY